MVFVVRQTHHKCYFVAFKECKIDSDCAANAYCDTTSFGPAICTCLSGYFGDAINEGCKGKN